MILICYCGGAFSVLHFMIGKDALESILLTVTFLILFFFVSHIGDFTRYTKGKELYKNMQKPNCILSENIKTYIPNYNAFGVSGFRDKMLVNKNGNMRFTEYFFDRSDILFSNGSAYLFGYGDRFLLTSYALPIEIEKVGYRRYFNSAKLVSFNITPGKIYMQIKDPSYKEPIKLELEYRKELEAWLTAP